MKRILIVIARTGSCSPPFRLRRRRQVRLLQERRRNRARHSLHADAGKGPFPALVVIHEFWGLNDWVKEQASKLADQGYVSLAIDLYRGKVATTPDMAHEIMRGVPEDRAKRDLHAAVEFLKSQPNVKKDRIGAIGWCMGGGYALDVALQEPDLAAARDQLRPPRHRPGSAEENQCFHPRPVRRARIAASLPTT